MCLRQVKRPSWHRGHRHLSRRWCLIRPADVTALVSHPSSTVHIDNEVAVLGSGPLAFDSGL